MSNEVMAVIQLMPGQVGYYDDLSRIHLTMGSPKATVYKGTNVSQIRRSVQSGRLKIISGSLGTEKAPLQTKEGELLVKKDGKYMLAHNIETKEEELKKPVEVKEAQIPKESIPEVKNEAETVSEEETKAEEKVEIENEKEEIKPEKKRTSRKKTTSKE